MQSFLLFILIHITLCQGFKIPLKKTQFNMFNVPVLLGSGSGNGNGIQEELTLDLTENVIAVYGNADYQPQKSQTSMPLTIDEFNDMYYDRLVFKYNKDVVFNSVPIEQRMYTSSGTHGHFGFVYQNYSLLHTVFTTLNTKKLFYIDTHALELVIGEYPPNQHKAINRTCNMVHMLNSHYACHLNSAYFKNAIKNEYIHYTINTNITFCTSKNAIYTNDEFANLLYKNYLIEQIKEGTCEEIHSDSKLKFVRCKYNYDYKHDTRLTDITFILGKFSFKLRRDELFALGSDNKLYFLIVNNPGYSGWFFGYPFFNKFITVFDIERELISFVPVAQDD